MIKKILAALFFCIIPLSLSALEGYSVRFEGVEDAEALRLLRSASQLISLEDSPPATTAGLRRRAEADLPNLVRALHSLAYFGARISLNYDFSEEVPTVVVAVDSGPVYPLESFYILPAKKESSFPFDTLTPEAIGVCIGAPATPKMITNGESALIELMENYGYPFAVIASSEIEADQGSHTLHVALYLDPGPRISFGPLFITGNSKTKERFIRKKLFWREGEIYCPSKIDRTRRALENSGLFSSVGIEHAEEPPQEGEALPITIHLHEAKRRTLGFGINYSTLRGPGASAEWEHRNLTGMGDRLSFRTIVWKGDWRGRLSYLIPDFCRPSQDLLWVADYRQEKTEGYTANSFSLSAMLERRWNRCLKSRYGIRYTHLRDTNIHDTDCYSPESNPNEEFNLLKVPLRLYWNNTGSVFDPGCGIIWEFNSIPSYQFIGNTFVYDINTFELSSYLPLSCRLTAAGKVNLGSIVGPSKQTIPRSELFDAGTDKLLRGYAYKTVSPLDSQFKPTGGRSLMIYSFELRYRFSCEYGGVLFYDLGNVYSAKLPQFDKPLLHSVGVGFRYYTPVAPVRFDIAVPLSIRKGIDQQRVQFYLNIGQSF